MTKLVSCLATAIKLGVVSTFVCSFVLFHIYFFLERSPPANTKHFDDMNTNPLNFADLNLFSIHDESSIVKEGSSSSPGKNRRRLVQPKSLRKIALDEIGTVNSTKVVNDDDEKTYYTIFQIHGTPGSRRWRYPVDHHFVRTFGGDKKLRILSLDRPGIGQSTPIISSIDSEGNPVYNLEPFNVDYYEASALDLLYVVRKLRLKHFSLFAYSQGAAHATMLSHYLEQLKKRERGEKVTHAHLKSTERFHNDLMTKILLSKDSEKYWTFENGVSNYTSSTEWSWKDVTIDRVVLMAPQGFYSEKVRQALLKEQDMTIPEHKRWSSNLHQIYSFHNYQPPLGTNIVHAVYKMVSQLGFITNIKYWEENMKFMLDPLGRDSFIFHDEATGWKKAFNNTMIDTYRFTTMTFLVEVYNSYYFTENYGPNFDISLKNIPTWILKAEDDILVPIEAFNTFVEKVCTNKETCNVTVASNTTHFQIFKNYYTQSIQHLVKGVFGESVSLRKPRRKIIVIGSGLAGLTATLESAYTYDQDVVLIEKEPRLGGNSAKATSGMNAIQTTTQRNVLVFDSYTHFWNDTIKSFTGGKVLSTLKEARRIIRNPKNKKKVEGEENLITENSWRILETLVKDSKPALQFLQSFDVKMDVVSQCGGHSKPRTHRSINKSDKPINIGSDIISKLSAFIREKLAERVVIKTEHHAIQLISEENDLGETIVKGVKVLNIKENTTETIMGDSIILAAGGYGQDRDGYLKQFAPHSVNLPSTNGLWATGDGIKMAVRDVNASLIDMGEIQIHPTAFVDPANPTAMTLILAPESLRGYGAIIVNQEGKRFVNELGTRDEEGNYPHVTAYMIMNEFVMKSFGESLTSFYAKKGLIRKYENFEDLCQKEELNMSANFCANLEDTIIDYDYSVDYRRSDPNYKDSFGKTVFPSKFNLEKSKETTPFFVARITPAVHYTQGGLLFNNKAQVLRRKTQDTNEVIRNLYAAGEVTGGCHGKNRLAGNSLLECVVFGRIAASEAAQE
ncbi:NADH-dependent fumarate reductase [Naegleria gruberi]|uniref:NADH-dependent fumarate reductase n=1 Tax=Naegleria gruberi TaxID=5762 RepID=D2V8X8_NAEGR|nr:NADH-dependent fumarate reductase [Naegleria gruberi]EFC46768.1 NADH-dependent fumarate reductase [Naegleria gruberi]|eukprot:XP_002679512.1 NADH-dependent fumarate reductase [Naegleria gruberi strain NEG-M]